MKICFLIGGQPRIIDMVIDNIEKKFNKHEIFFNICLTNNFEKYEKEYINSSINLESIKLNKTYIVFGKINDFKGNLSIPHPELEIYNEINLKKRMSLFAVYPSTENLNKKGITNKVFSKLIEEVLINVNKNITENLPK